VHCRLGLAEHATSLGEPAALALTVRTLDELTGVTVRPVAWSAATYIAKATGRLPLDHPEQRLLGDQADAFPALG
jgi:hypothetical protein